MKILLVANTDWYLYNFRLLLANYLRSLGNEVVLCSPPGQFTSKLVAAGYRWISWQVGRRTLDPAGEWAAMKRLEKIYKAEQPDLVHHFTVKPVLYGSMAAKAAGVPAVVNSITGLGYVFLEPRMRGKALRQVVVPLYRRAFRHPNLAVIFENDSDRQVFINLHLVGEANSRVIAGVGVDIDRFCPAPEPGGSPLVIFPSRMLLDKGLGVLVEAAKMLKGSVYMRIALVGQPDPGNPATVTEQDLHTWQQQGWVEYWGFQDDMAAVFQQCHLVTLPSMGEGLPTSLIEAAACGRAIVATDVPGCRDVVVDGVNGLLVPPSQPEPLAKALAQLIADSELRRRMGAAGRELAVERFRSEKIHEMTWQVYQQVLDGLL